MVNVWKVTTFIFIGLFILTITFGLWLYSIGVKEQNNLNTCYYDICSDSYDATYEDDVCMCYDLNEYGEYENTNTIIMR